MKLENAWDFVEAYFPDYYSSDEILRNNDLKKRLDEYDEDEDDLEDLEEQLKDSDSYVYKKAIEAYIALDAEQEKSKSTYYIFGSEWVRVYFDEGIEGVIKNYHNAEEDCYTDGASFEFIEGETKSVEFADAFDGWFEYAIITEKEYKQLNK